MNVDSRPKTLCKGSLYYLQFCCCNSKNIKAIIKHFSEILAHIFVDFY